MCEYIENINRNKMATLFFLVVLIFLTFFPVFSPFSIMEKQQSFSNQGKMALYK